MRFKRALVTGGAGFIGSHLARKLADSGIETVVLDDLSTGSREKIPSGVEFVEGSVTDAVLTRKALDGVDVVFHLAARVSTRESLARFEPDAQTNIMGTLNLLSAGRDLSVKRLIFASSAAVYAEGEPGESIGEDHSTRPSSPYGISKLSSEMYVSNIYTSTGTEYFILRYFNAYGPGQPPGPYAGVITTFVNSALDGKPPTILGDGEQVRDFVHIDDIVRATVLAMESEDPGHVLNVGTGRPCSVYKLARLVLEELGSGLEPDHGPTVEGEIKYSVAYTERAKQVLGFEASQTLEERLGDVISRLAGRR